MEFRRLGRAIKEWRLARGLSLEQAAMMVGTTGATLSRLERGLHKPRRKLALRLSELLGEQPLLPMEWRREPRLDEAAQRFLSAAAHRKVRMPADVEQYAVWHTGEGAFLILPLAGGGR